MNPKLTSDSRARTVSTEPPSSINSPYAASVPLSVYRELAAELQTTKDKLDAATRQNQILSQQNQTLREHIDHVFQSALSLHQLAHDDQEHDLNDLAMDDLADHLAVGDLADSAASQDSNGPVLKVSDDISEELRQALVMQPPLTIHPASRKSAKPSERKPSNVKLPFSDDQSSNIDAFFTEIGHQPGSSHQHTKSPRIFSGVWLVLTITVIVITGFSTGFGIIWYLQNQPSD